jgi:hypothetical protein
MICASVVKLPTRFTPVSVMVWSTLPVAKPLENWPVVLMDTTVSEPDIAKCR